MSILYNQKAPSVNCKSEDTLWSEIVNWKKAIRGIHLKPAYIDIAGSIPGGVLLSQIIYWHLGTADEESRLQRCTTNGKYWIAKSYAEWWNETRLTEGQVRRILNALEKSGIIETAYVERNNVKLRWVRILPVGLHRELYRVTNDPPKPATGHPKISPMD